MSCWEIFRQLGIYGLPSVRSPVGRAGSSPPSPSELISNPWQKIPTSWEVGSCVVYPQYSKHSQWLGCIPASQFQAVGRFFSDGILGLPDRSVSRNKSRKLRLVLDDGYRSIANIHLRCLFLASIVVLGRLMLFSSTVVDVPVDVRYVS